MRAIAFIVLVCFAVAVYADEDTLSLHAELSALVPEVTSNSTAPSNSSSSLYTTPLKAKLFQLQKKLEKELAELVQRKDDMAQAVAKSKLKLETATKVYKAAKNELERKQPIKMEGDYNVLLVRASLEVVIRAAKRQIKLNNLERDALYAQIKFAEQAQVLRSRIVGEKPSVALVSVEDLEAEAAPEAVALLQGRRETVLSKDVQKSLDGILKECRARPQHLDDQDANNSAEIKRLQGELKNSIKTQDSSSTEWQDSKHDFKRAETNMARHQGMYKEMSHIARRDTAALDEKIRVVQKEIKLVGSMILKIEAYKPNE